MSENDIVVSQQHAARPPPIALGINVEKPKFPQYAVYAKRMESFDAWPEYLPVKKDDLVEAGLVYTGVGDSVRCYFCGGGLRNWEQDDVPMEEHAKWYPKCPHILLVKGQAYVEKLGREEKPEEDSSSVQTDSAMKGPNHLESVAAQSCLKMDYPKEMVQRAINIFIDRYGNSDFKARHLCEILMDLEEELTESSPYVSENVVDCRRHIPTFEEELESDYIQTPEEIENWKEKHQRLKENQMCKSCLDKRADVMSLPCGHKFSCPQCAPALSKCPICRKTVIGHIKPFFDVRKHIPTVERELESDDMQTPEEIENLQEEEKRLKENQMCKICLDKLADVMFLPCGHMVSCPQCAPALSKCPICRKSVNGHFKPFFDARRNVPIVSEKIENLKEKKQGPKENQMCKICLDKLADVKFMPCWHMVSCSQCAPAFSKCPICRKTVIGHIKPFFDGRPFGITFNKNFKISQQ